MFFWFFSFPEFVKLYHVCSKTYFRFYYFSNVTEIAIFGSKLSEKLEYYHLKLGLSNINLT